MKSSDQQPDDFGSLCERCLIIGFMLLLLCAVVAAIAQAFASNAQDSPLIDIALAIAMIVAVAGFFVVDMLALSVPIHFFAKFRRRRYRVSLKWLFLITAIVAAVCAVARYMLTSHDDSTRVILYGRAVTPTAGSNP
jgi:hypothetical protein